MAQVSAAGGGNRELATGQRGQRGGSKRHDDGRTHVGQFLLEPDVTGRDVSLQRSLVDTALATQLVEKMLDRVGDEDVRRRDAGLEQQLA